MVNRLLHSTPATDSTTYVHAPPGWVLATCRIALGSMGLLLAVMTWRSWADMPLPARTLALFLAPALSAASIWPRPWDRMVKFMVDSHGVYFPANELLVLSFRPATQQHWLHVPWKNVSNIRLAREVGEDGQCVAFDIQASSAEVVAFFKHVGKPRDQSPDPGTVSLAYGDSPPHPTKTVKHLLSLKARGEV
jgi:hypothetical protein